MKKLLIINSSARTRNSHSRKLTEVFVDHWKSIYIDPVISFRELGNATVQHINEDWIVAASKPKATRSAAETEILKTSDSYISELREADVIVLGAPMYNWSIPSVLKAYIDQIIRIHETWRPDPAHPQHPYAGLLENKTLYLLLSRGANGYEKGEHNEHMNFQSTYLKTVFNIIGIRNIHMVAISGASLDAELLKKSIDTSHQNIRELIGLELSDPLKQIVL